MNINRAGSCAVCEPALYTVQGEMKIIKKILKRHLSKKVSI